MIVIAKVILLLFGLFLIGIGFLMFLKPENIRATLRKAGSTNFINYTEITIRIIPAIAFVIYSETSEYPDIFNLIGWFMIATSFILYFVPRKLHHNFAVKSADILKPNYFKLLSPISILFGSFLIYFLI